MIITENFFGMHCHFHSGLEMPDAPYSTYRIWDCGCIWAGLQPKKNKWDFSQLDKVVEVASEKCKDIIFVLGQAPKWASDGKAHISIYGGNTTSSPPTIESWVEYIKVLAKRYKGKIKYWEIWNEPDWKKFYTGSIEKGS